MLKKYLKLLFQQILDILYNPLFLRNPGINIFSLDYIL